MLITISILAIAAAIIILIIQYIRVHARVLSRESIEHEAKTKAKKMKYDDPIITCDYCGSIIDTRVEKICPSCGAPYADDEEWTTRYDVSPEWSQNAAEQISSKMFKKAKDEFDIKAKRIKRAIFLLSALMVLIILIYSISENFGRGPHYETSDELNKYSFENYIMADYDIAGNRTILEEEGVIVNITGIYEDNENHNRTVKIEYTIDNTNDYPINLQFQRVSVNGFSQADRAGFFYGWVKKNTALTKYDQVYFPKGEEVTSIDYADFEIRDKDYNSKHFNNIVHLDTTSKKSYKKQMPQGTTLFEKDGIKIVNAGIPDEDKGYVLYIQNDSESDYKVKSTDLTIGGKETVSTTIYDDIIPAGVLYKSSSLYPMTESYLSDIGEEEVLISLSFKNLKDPSGDFATGYLNLNP